MYKNKLPPNFPKSFPEFPEDLEELERNSILIGRDKDGTEYYAPKDYFKADRDLKFERAKAWHRRDIKNRWWKIWFEFRMLLDDMRWYLETSLKG